MTTAIQTAKPTAEKGIMSFVPFGAKDEIKLSLDIIKRFVAIKTRSGATCDDAQAMKFMMLCQAQRLNPFAGDAFLTGYDGKNGPQFSLITAHVAFLKRAEVSPEYEGMQSGVILLREDGSIEEREGDFKLADEKVVGGWARVFRKGRKDTYRRLSIASMKPNYETPFWNDDKAPGQIVKCAEADALRSTFPTLLGGLYNEGEAERMPTIDISSTPSSLVATKQVTEGQEAPVDGMPAPSAAAQGLNGEQKELEALVLANGFTLEHLAKWGEETGNIPQASSLPSFEAIPTDICKRLLKAKAGLLKGLAAVKGGAA